MPELTNDEHDTLAEALDELEDWLVTSLAEVRHRRDNLHVEKCRNAINQPVSVACHDLSACGCRTGIAQVFDRR